MGNTIKKENEVTNVTNLGDNDCIRATLANGQSVSIKKSDLMPVLVEGIGKWLGNADTLSTFTNVLVNNGQTLGKATIENLASVVSGINIHIWDNNTNLDNVDATTYIIDFRGIIINNLGICGSGFSICSGLYTVQFGITNWGLIYRFCETNQKHWSAWRII